MILKYMKPHFVDGFFRDGTLKIGTLYDFRNVEKYGQDVGDENEGLKSLHTKIEGRHTKETAPPIVNRFIELGEGAAIQDCILVDAHDSPDCFVFCASDEYSTALLDSFQATRCISIDNPEGFYNAITKAILRKIGVSVDFKGVFKVQYIARNMKHEEDHGFPAALIKDPIPRYMEQKEVRAIWELSTPHPIEPILIQCPEARQFCSIYPKPFGAV